MSTRRDPAPLSPAVTLLSVTLLCVTIMGSIAWTLHEPGASRSTSITRSTGNSGSGAMTVPTVVVRIILPTPPPTATPEPTRTPLPTLTPTPSDLQRWGSCEGRPAESICVPVPGATVVLPTPWPVCGQPPRYWEPCVMPGSSEDYSAETEVE